MRALIALIVCGLQFAKRLGVVLIVWLGNGSNFGWLGATSCERVSLNRCALLFSVFSLLLVWDLSRFLWPISIVGNVLGCDAYQTSLCSLMRLCSHLRRWSPVGWGPIACRRSGGSTSACGRSSCRNCARVRRAVVRPDPPPTPWLRRRPTVHARFSPWINTGHTHNYMSMWSRNRTRTWWCLGVSLRVRVTCLWGISCSRLPNTADHHWGISVCASANHPDASTASLLCCCCADGEARCVSAPPPAPAHSLLHNDYSDIYSTCASTTARQCKAHCSIDFGCLIWVLPQVVAALSSALPSVTFYRIFR